jgi:hypothetical protein
MFLVLTFAPFRIGCLRDVWKSCDPIDFALESA